MVGGVSVKFLLDTGSSVTIIHPHTWEQLPLDIRQSLRPWDQSIIAAEGSTLQVLGCTEVVVRFGKFHRRHLLLVAPITQPGILGMDFLTLHGGVLDIPGRKLKLDAWEVPLVSENVPATCCRISIAETVTVPAGHEAVVPGELHLRSGGVWQGVVEPSSRFVSKDDSILIGRTYVSSTRSRVPLRILNLRPEATILYKGSQIALLQPAEIVEDETDITDSVALGSALEELYERSSQSLNQDQQVKLKELLYQHKDTFSESGELGRTNLVYHEINTGNARPIRQPARRLPHHQRSEAQAQVDEMLKSGVISPSSGPWASPIVLVKKKDGSTRFCVDYRKLNDTTLKDAYPLPRIDDSLDALSGSAWFSSLDLASGYWQVEMNPDDRQKTAFSTGSGLYEFNVMPFGLTNAPSTFERLMELVLAGLHWKTCLVYLDDILIYAQTFEEHASRLTEVFARLATAGLKLKPKKCTLFQKEVAYLGHVVSAKGVATDPEKTRKVREWPTPSNVKEVRSFVGLCSYYRRFIKDFARLAAPLHKLTQKDVRFKWTPECEHAFQVLKVKLTSTPILAFPDFSHPFILDTDASGETIGAVLSQIQDGKERAIAYASRKLSKSEQNYSVTKKELLAVVHFVKYYRHYLYGRRFMIRTDHGSLRWLFNFKDPQGQLARWIETLSTFDFEICHRQGTQHKNADALSRLPRPKDNVDACPQVSSFVCSSLSHTFVGLSSEELRKAQRADEALAVIIKWMETRGDKPPRNQVMSCSREVKGYWYLWEQLELRDGILYRHCEVNSSTFIQVVVPSSMKRDVLMQAHNVRTAGHLGQSKTFKKIQRTYYWLGCRTEVQRWVKQCEACARKKSPSAKARAALQNSLVGAPLERVAVDIFGPLPRSRLGNRYILVVTDYFTKWAEAYPLRNQEAETVARVLVEQFICRFGVPLSLHSDQGSNFESNVFQSVCKLLGIHKTRTTAYHPQSDGLVERLNRTIQNMLSIYVREDQVDWDVHLPYVMMAYRASEQETVGVSPNRMMFGREVSLPLELLVTQSHTDEYGTAEAYATGLYERMQKAFDVARKNIKGEQKRQKRLYDAKLKGKPYAIGDKVWLYCYVRKIGLSPKLQSHWKGPYVVIKRISDAVYRIKHTISGQRIIVHFDRLKPCFSSLPEQIADDTLDTASQAESDELVGLDYTTTTNGVDSRNQGVKARDTTKVLNDGPDATREAKGAAGGDPWDKVGVRRSLEIPDPIDEIRRRGGADKTDQQEALGADWEADSRNQGVMRRGDTVITSHEQDVTSEADGAVGGAPHGLEIPDPINEILRQDINDVTEAGLVNWSYHHRHQGNIHSGGETSPTVFDVPAAGVRQRRRRPPAWMRTAEYLI